MAIPLTNWQVDMGDVLTAHLRNYREGLPIEQAYDGTRILSQFEVDRNRTIDGGGYIHTQVSAMQAPLGDWYAAGDTVDDSESKEDTMAITKLSFLSEPIKVWRDEVLKAQGERALFSYIENKHNQAMRRIRFKIETALMAATTETSGYTSGAAGVTSFRETCAVDPTTGIVDGINRATAGNEYWRNQTENIGSLATGGYEALEKLSLNCQKGGESDWDYGFTDPDTFLALKKQHREFLSLNAFVTESALGKRMVDLGIPVIEFEGKPLFWSPRVPNADGLSGLIYLCRKDAFSLAVHPDEEFKLIGPFPLENSNGHGLKWFVMWAGQLVWQLPSACGVGHAVAP